MMEKKKYYYQIEFPDETIDSRDDDEYFDAQVGDIIGDEYWKK